jgi:hypothetical protein
MKWTRTKAGLAIIGWAVATYAMAGCASTRSVRDYDGGSIEIQQAPDSVQLVLVTIQNDRSRDMTDPTFYIIGSAGRHSLGIVRSLSTRRILVDSQWLRGADGCVRIVAHYAGLGELTYDKVCWRPGEKVDVTLSTLFNSGAAWSHR